MGCKSLTQSEREGVASALESWAKRIRTDAKMEFDIEISTLDDIYVTGKRLIKTKLTIVDSMSFADMMGATIRALPPFEHLNEK